MTKKIKITNLWYCRNVIDLMDHLNVRDYEIDRDDSSVVIIEDDDIANYVLNWLEIGGYSKGYEIKDANAKCDHRKITKTTKTNELYKLKKEIDGTYRRIGSNNVSVTDTYYECAICGEKLNSIAITERCE